jgi:hypothetical protein
VWRHVAGRQAVLVPVVLKLRVRATQTVRRTGKHQSCIRWPQMLPVLVRPPHGTQFVFRQQEHRRGSTGPHLSMCPGFRRPAGAWRYTELTAGLDATQCSLRGGLLKGSRHSLHADVRHTMQPRLERLNDVQVLRAMRGIYSPGSSAGRV